MLRHLRPSPLLRELAVYAVGAVAAFGCGWLGSEAAPTQVTFTTITVPQYCVFAIPPSQLAAQPRLELVRCLTMRTPQGTDECDLSFMQPGWLVVPYGAHNRAVPCDG